MGRGMKVNELVDTIKEHGVNKGWRVSIGGCELLEYISDIPGFVELLGKFFRWNGNDTDCISFVDDHPDPIEFILNGDRVIEFHFYFRAISICSYGGGSSCQYTFRVSDDDR